MTNATIIKNANKRNIFTLILVVFTLTENCMACCCCTDEGSMSDSSIFANIEKREPIANYCLNTKPTDEYFLKFESIIGSSVFTKMEERNCKKGCDLEELLRKKHSVKIEGRDSMTCSGSEVIDKEYSFLSKNTNLVTLCWAEGRSNSGVVGNSDSSWIYKFPTRASTELIIDFPDYPTRYIEDASKIPEIISSFRDTVLVSWKFKIDCRPHSCTTITGSYFVRITGECRKK
jgi:hypothetical protein